MNLKELLLGEYKDVTLEYAGSIFGTTDELWIDTGEIMYDKLEYMFGEDALEKSVVLDIHPVYTGKKGFYIQAGDIWNNEDGEQCVFAVIE
jgi:hypothetical protein